MWRSPQARWEQTHSSQRANRVPVEKLMDLQVWSYLSSPNFVHPWRRDIRKATDYPFTSKVHEAERPFDIGRQGRTTGSQADDNDWLLTLQFDGSMRVDI